MWSAFFFSRYNALTAPLSMRDPLLGLETWPCALRPRLSGNKASEEHHLRSDETNKTVRAQQRQHAVHSPRKVKPIVSSHKKGTAPEKTTSKHLSDLTRKGPFLKNKLCHLTRQEPLQAKQIAVSSHKQRDCSSKQTKTPIKIVATDHRMRVDLWNLVTTCGMALRLEILIAGGSVSPQAWSSRA